MSQPADDEDDYCDCRHEYGELCSVCEGIPWDDEYEYEVEVDDDYDDGRYDCSCRYCNCANQTEGGCVCNQCLEGAHQG